MRFGKFAHFALGLALAAGICLTATRPAQSETLDAVKQRGFLLCGVSAGVTGFSVPGEDGSWRGFDVDFCRALAAAIFDDTGKVKFVPLNATERFQALQAGTIDVLSRNSSWTISTEAGLKLIFAATTFYDGQGFMVRRDRNAATAEDLGNTKVCVQAATTSEQNAVDYFKANGMAMELVARPSAAEVLAVYESGACDVMTSDVSALYGERLKLGKPDEHVILPDVISKEALGPVVRGDDLTWFEIVKWTHFAMVDAEELGVATTTLDAALQSAKPEVRRLLGRDPVGAEKLGLSNEWAARIIRHVGNYAEVYDRNLGSQTQLGIPRGINELWSRGGILYAPPMR